MFLRFGIKKTGIKLNLPGSIARMFVGFLRWFEIEICRTLTRYDCLVSSSKQPTRPKPRTFMDSSGTETTVQITGATHRMVMEIHRIPTRGAGSRLLVFQDSVDDAGERSKEGEQTLKEIKSSFTVE